MRVLGAIRQSKTKDRAVSPEAQRKAITQWAEANGHTVVAMPEDLSRSGKVSAFKRPKLGPWLTDPARIANWDILVAIKMNRVNRNTADFLSLREWLSGNGKTYVSLSENIDLSTAAGRYNATQWAAAAEFERERMSEQRLETMAELAEQGRWTGGRVPFGYRAAETTEGFYLEPDDGGTAEIAREMARMAIDGHSNGQIQRWLNDNGHLTGTGKQWLVESVRQVLRSHRMEGLLSDDDAAKLRRALRNREQTRGERVGGHMLLRVAYCITDGGVMYGHVRNNRRMKGYYTCHICGQGVRMEKLEQQTEGSLLFLWGSDKMRRKVVIPGDDYAAQIRAVETDLEKLRDIADQSLVAAAIESAEAKLADLEAMPHEPDRIEWPETDITVADHWETLDDAGKGKFLRDANVRVNADAHRFEMRVTESGILRAEQV